MCRHACLPTSAVFKLTPFALLQCTKQFEPTVATVETPEMCIRALTFHHYQALSVTLCMCVCVYFHRAAGRAEDNRWLSGTYLLVHPAAKHLGNARVRLKVLLELNPQSSGRASSKQWQVPHIAPTVIRAAGYSPRRPTEHGPALRPHEVNRHDPLRASAQTSSCGKGECFDFDSMQQQPAEAVTAHHSMAMLSVQSNCYCVQARGKTQATP